MANAPQRGADEKLGELYRSVAAEKPSVELDQRILRRAKQATRREKPVWLRWLRPAIAATVVGSSLILVAGQYGLWNPNTPASGGAGVVQDFGDVARESKERIREFGGAVAPQVLNPDSLPADTYRNTAPSTSRYCRDEQVASRDAWEACISRLHESGRETEASEERRILRAAFADERR